MTESERLLSEIEKNTREGAYAQQVASERNAALARSLLVDLPGIGRTLRHIRAAMVVIALLLIVIAAGAGTRSAAVRAEFQRANPCPSTGKPAGACPGYQVDHREALICGGRDELANLQWLSVDEHKAKTRVEVKLCRPHRAP